MSSAIPEDRSAELSELVDGIGAEEADPDVEDQHKEAVYAVQALPKRRGPTSAKQRLIVSSFTHFWAVKLCQLLCAIYILMFILAGFGVFGQDSGMIDPNAVVDADAGIIIYNGAERAVVTTNAFQRFCLTMARLLAYSMYPVLVLVYLSKCRGTISFLSSSPFILYMFSDMHELHIYCGKYIFGAGILHSLFHFMRWADQHNLYLLFQNRSGLSGFIAFLCMLLIVVPMMWLKRRVTYEWRKLVHYLFFVMAVALAFHSPPSAVPNGGYAPYVFSIVIVWYILDYLYVYFCMSENIETTMFHVLPNGVQMSLRVSDNFYRRGEHGGFAYVCLPWVSRNQWHAFSLFENPDNPEILQVFMLSTGDWTNKVHECLKRDTHRPVYIQGPFPSPYSYAGSYDNQILVASGIGITPALSIIHAHKESRRTNLIWAVRDASMLEFFLQHMYLDHSGWNMIFYTGSTPLNPLFESLNTNVRIIKGRPTLSDVIPNIIYGIETETGMPENYLPERNEEIKDALVLKMKELDGSDLTPEEKLVSLREFVSKEGYLFTDLVASLEEESIQKSGPIGSSLRTSTMRPLSSSVMPIDEEAEDNSRSRLSTSLRTSLMRSTIGRRQSSERRGGVHLRKDSAADLGVTMESRTVTEVAMPAIESSHILGVVRGLDAAGVTERSSSLTPRQEVGRSLRRGRNSLMWSMMRKDSSSRLSAAFCPSQENKEAQTYVKSLDYNTVLSTWGILYCGGSKPVERSLKSISEEYNLQLHTESFEW